VSAFRELNGLPKPTARIGQRKKTKANELDQVGKMLSVHPADISAAIHSRSGRGAQGYDNDEMDANLGLDQKAREEKSARLMHVAEATAIHSYEPEHDAEDPLSGRAIMVKRPEHSTIDSGGR
jgi:hypothetical protein